ncbi:MAG: heme biosynthesis protein HemY [Xanthobacteraceae bacterium]|nr:heme biosynthesis protein HemY [Xanthobacteraceae bacterium]
MFRIVVFLLVLAAVALGAAWIANQGGGVTLSWGAWQAETSLAVFIAAIIAAVAAILLMWSIFRAIWKTPGRLRRRGHERREAKGRRAITQGLIAVGTGDPYAARQHAGVAKRLAAHDPLALVLHAQTAQLEGDHAAAQRAFHQMAEREDTRLLGLRGLFIEAQRNDDPYTAVAMAEEALKTAPASPWASQAVLGFRCAKADWDGAVAILENNYAAGLVDPETYRRQRGVLLTARAQELEQSDRDVSRKSIMEAVKLAPTLVPAAALAAKFYSEDNQIRRAMRVIETAWTTNPHPDLADAYAHVRLGDSARERLARVVTLAQKTPESIEGRLAIARAAIDAGEFPQAREALKPLIATPTQRVALLMAELERAENGDEGRMRHWMLRAVRAAHDPVWTADGYVSNRWRPVSPVTGRIDAFRWIAPVAALPSDGGAIDAATEALLAAPPIRPVVVAIEPVKNDKEPAQDEMVAAPAPPAADNPPADTPPAPAEPVAPPPVFRPRPAGEKPNAVSPAVIPLVRAPDDPGVPEPDSFDSDPERGDQPGGWKGFFTRLGG